jgi:hypothetical protein
VSDKHVKPKKPRKRAWQPPTVKTGLLFESNSLACGKTPVEEGCQQMGMIKSS